MLNDNIVAVIPGHVWNRFVTYRGIVIVFSTNHGMIPDSLIPAFGQFTKAPQQGRELRRRGRVC